jgi:hypothetical protein
MSADRFDKLTKALATGTSRRTVLKALVATVAGGVLASLGASGLGASEVAVPCTFATDCGRNEICLSGECFDCGATRRACSGPTIFTGTCCNKGPGTHCCKSGLCGNKNVCS